MSGILTNLYNSTSFALRMHANTMMGLQEQASTGSRVNRASDDPSVAYRVLGLESNQKSIQNYMDNIADTISTLGQSSTILDSMASRISDTKVNLTQIISGTYGEGQTGQVARQRVAGQINDVLEEMVSLANTEYSGRSIFGGSNTTSAPYTVERTNGQISSVAYQGSYQNINIEVASGIQSNAYCVGESIFCSDNRSDTVFCGESGASAGSGTSNIKGVAWLSVTDDGSGSYNLSIDDGATTVNVAASADISNIAVTNGDGDVLYVDATNIDTTGVEMVQAEGSYDLFDTLINIRDLLNNERDLPEATVVSLIDRFSAPLEELRGLLVDKQASIGTKIGFLNDLKNSLEDVKFNASDEATVLQEADIAQVAIDLSRREVLYQMTLSVTGKLMSMSLLDYL